jgi:putative transposase
VISDESWGWLEPLLPDRTRRRGGQWRDHREVLEAIAWRYRTGSPWRDLPAEFGPWQSVYDRHVRWSRDGTYDRILAAAHTAAEAAGDLDWLVAADSSLMRVHQHGATARRWSGNAATVSVGHGTQQPDGADAVEAQVGDLASDTGGPAGIFG